MLLRYIFVSDEQNKDAVSSILLRGHDENIIWHSITNVSPHMHLIKEFTIIIFEIVDKNLIVIWS